MSGATEPGRSGPRHVGIIMDGNGRWAAQRGRPRIAGHRAGAAAVRRITEAAVEVGLDQLTVYAFSSENWNRPAGEVRALMRLFKRYLHSECERLLTNGVRLRAIGRIRELPDDVQKELDRTMSLTKGCSRLDLCLAINYGGRNELVDAARKLARRATRGQLAPDAIDEATLSSHLYQPDMPPLDLVIRTGGEMRLSNFLLWQAAYAEFWATTTCWPDFGREHLCEAVAVFQGRERRFGGVSSELGKHEGQPQPIVLPRFEDQGTEREKRNDS